MSNILKSNIFDETCYVSIDVETTGPIPGKYSMLAIGATIIRDYNKNERPYFYKELQPLNYSYDIDAMKIACLSLDCLKPYVNNSEYNPKDINFQPKKVLDTMFTNCDSPKNVMQEFSEWIYSVSKNRKIVEVASPIKFDGMFTSWYFHTFLGYNPLGYSGIDINSFYKGFKKDFNSSIKELNLRSIDGLTHNALEDAIQQAVELEAIITLMKHK